MERLGTATEAAEYLRISLKTFYALAENGGVPGARRVGNQWRVDMDVLRGQVSDDNAPLASNSEPGATQ